MIKNVIFDIDNTLYNFDVANKAGINALTEFTCENIGIDPKRFIYAYNLAREQTKILLPDLASGHNRLLYCQKALENLNYRPCTFALKMYDVFWNTYLQNMFPFEGLDETFAWLKSKKIRIGICSDLTAHIQMRKLIKLNIADKIDAFVTSEEAGCEKPDFKIFQLILDKMNADPKETMMVGDSIERDIKGAINLKILPVLITNEQKYSESFLTIHSLKEIRNIVEERSGL